jgi:hypothetical protein
MTLGSKRILQASIGDILSVGAVSIRTTGGEASLVFVFWLLLVPLF